MAACRLQRRRKSIGRGNDLKVIWERMGWPRRPILSLSPGNPNPSLDDDAGDALPLPDPSPTAFSGGSSTRDMASVSDQPALRVQGYSLAKGMGIGKHVASETFTMGYPRAIYFYPDRKNRVDNSTYISLFIALASEGTDVRPTPQDHSLESGTYHLKYCVSMW